jgi:hypothetical protein
MARSSMCPPGVFCLSTGVLLCIVLFICIGAALVLKSSTTVIMQPSHAAPSHTALSHTALSQHIVQQDSRFNQAPQPLRDWMGRPEFPPRGGLTSMPINIPTQGLPESFQSVGVIQVDDKVLPLYGRRTGRGSDRWNYYTRTDTYNPVPIPVNFQKRKCMDDVGCQEILSGDDVKIEVLNKQGKTSIYDYGGPKYIPGII